MKTAKEQKIEIVTALFAAQIAHRGLPPPENDAMFVRRFEQIANEILTGGETRSDEKRTSENQSRNSGRK